MASAIFDFQSETGQPFPDRAVELGLVFLVQIRGERLREVVSEISEQLGSGLDEILVVAVALLGLVARRAVIGALGRDALANQAAVLAFEQVELALDHVGKAAMEERHAPRLATPL